MEAGSSAVKEGRQFTFRDMLAMVFRRKWIIVIIFLVMLSMGVSASLKTTSEYQAVAKVLLRRTEGSSFSRMRTPFLGLEEEMNTEIEILRSRPVLERAIREIDRELADLPDAEKAMLFPPASEEETYHTPEVKWVDKNLQAEPIEKSNVIMIRFRNQNAAVARMLADAVANSYVAERITIRRNPMLMSFYEDRTRGLQDNLLDLRTELGQLRVDSGVFDHEWQQRLGLGTLDELRMDLMRARIRRSTAEAKLDGLRQRMAMEPDNLVLIQEFEDNNVFQELRRKLIEKKSALNDLRARYMPDHPKVRHAETLVALLQEDLRAEIATQVRVLEAEVEDLRAHEDALAEGVREVIAEVERIPQYEPRLRQLEREITNAADLYELVSAKMMDTQISETEDQRMVNAKVLNPATVSLSFVQQRKGLFALFAALLGISLGLALAFLLEGLDHTMRTPEDVELNLGVRLLGSIPELKPAGRR